MKLLSNLSILGLMLLFLGTARAEKILILVNKENPVSSLTSDQLRDFFLKRTREWQNKQPVRFFDRLDDSPERKLFLDLYIKKSSRQVDQHWIGQKLYSGDSAPSQVGTDSMVANLVSRFPGGIGYVSEKFQAPASVKVIPIIGN
jgi:ABC-type phosphate transport system substrate-binding protein